MIKRNWYISIVEKLSWAIFDDYRKIFDNYLGKMRKILEMSIDFEGPKIKLTKIKSWFTYLDLIIILH